MLLYEVAYFGNTIDSNMPLPEPAPNIRYAHCTNGPDEWLIPGVGLWLRATREDALARGR